MTSAGQTGNLSHNEVIKLAVPTLAGTIRQSLDDASQDRFSEDDNQFLKFHGIYQQTDRDRRGAEKTYLMMVRCRIPGGLLTADQYLGCDALSTRFGNDTLRITSRQSFQFHCVLKHRLGALIKGINETLLTTLSGCGDVNRNVMAPPSPARDQLGERVHQDARAVAAALSPRTPAYHAIWLEGTPLNLEDPKLEDFEDPLYGKTYLPRKFKLAFAIPPHNDVDILANCAGFIAITDAAGKLLGYNLTAGGGMGRSHGNEATFPRIADVIGFLPADRVVGVARAVLTIHRDFGDRANRKHARLKYVIADRGVDWFRAELEQRIDFRLEPARPFEFKTQGEDFGWHRQADGKWFLCLFVEVGRIKDRPGFALKTALREVVGQFRPQVRLTPTSSVILANLDPAHREAIDALLASHGVRAVPQATPTRLASMACVALPTCGLALAESERCLPGLLTKIEAVQARAGLSAEVIVFRMTGCPNGCVRPYLAEVGLVGRAPGRYQMWLGGNEASTRMNRVYKESVKEADIPAELETLFSRFTASRQAGERFGDWCARVIWPETETAAAAAT